MKVAIVTHVRNEADRIEEWVRYHRLIGIDEFFCIDDKSTDNTLEMMESLGVNVVENAFLSDIVSDISRGMDPYTELKFCNRQKSNMHNAICIAKNCGIDWVFCIDTDEFLVFDYLGVDEYLEWFECEHDRVPRIVMPSFEVLGPFNNESYVTLQSFDMWSLKTCRDFYHVARRVKCAVSCEFYSTDNTIKNIHHIISDDNYVKSLWFEEDRDLLHPNYRYGPKIFHYRKRSPSIGYHPSLSILNMPFDDHNEYMKVFWENANDDKH